MKIRRKSSQSSFFVNPYRTIKSAVECLESSRFLVRRLGSGYFGKISPTFMKSWCSCQNNQMAYNGPGYVKCGILKPMSCPPDGLLFSCNIFIFSSQPAFDIANVVLSCSIFCSPHVCLECIRNGIHKLKQIFNHKLKAFTNT
jgi:hypothetical protein